MKHEVPIEYKLLMEVSDFLKIHVRSTVTTDDPLAAFYQIVCQFGQFGASRATGSFACLDHRDEFPGNSCFFLVNGADFFPRFPDCIFHRIPDF